MSDANDGQVAWVLEVVGPESSHDFNK